MRARNVPAAIAAVLTAVLCVVSGCSGISGQPAPSPEIVVDAVAPDFVFGTDGGEIDRLAATVVTDAQAYWSRAYPRHFPGQWHDLDGGFFSVDTTDTRADPPPCTSEVADVEGNAYYCGTVDAIAWDRAALLPVLREHYGPAAVVVVLAHEMGHAVRHRATTPRDENGGERPSNPAFAELVSDCYAGAYTSWVVAGNSRHLRISEDQLDGAMRALAGFRDPVGTPSSASSAHGSAFDRVSAFQDGFRGGPGLCRGMTPANRLLTGERPFLAPAPAEQGNKRPADVIRSHVDGLNGFFADVLAQRGKAWSAPSVDRSGRRCARSDARVTAAISYCRIGNRIVVDRRRLARVNYEIGDQASATILASRYAQAAVHQLIGSRHGKKGTAASAACLTGAYTGWLLDGHGDGTRLTAGDLDEAVTALLSGGGVTGKAELSGFDAVTAFRSGVRNGAAGCEL